jgi:hypothetical protein
MKCFSKSRRETWLHALQFATHIHKRDKNYVAIKNNSSKECKCTVSYHYLDLVLALWSNGVYSSVE